MHASRIHHENVLVVTAQHSSKFKIETLESLILLSSSCHGFVELSISDCSSDCHDLPQCGDSSYSFQTSCGSGSSPNVFDDDCYSACVGSDCGTSDSGTGNSGTGNSGTGNSGTNDCDDSNEVDNFDSILEWNEIMLDANAADHAFDTPDQAGPIMTARAFAIVSAAMYDAYNSIEHIGESYLVNAQYTNGANVDAAVAQAAYETLVELFPSQKATFDAELAESLARIEDGASEDLGRRIGIEVAEAIIAIRENDGYDQFKTDTYIPNGLPGFHDVDPLNPNQGFYAPNAVDIAPFAVLSADQFQSDPIDDGTAEGRQALMNSEKYLTAFNEVKAIGGDGITTPTTRTAEQTEIGMFWGYDGRPNIGAPPRMYNEIARVVAEQQGNSEAENARMFALVNISMADAGITSWNTKYDDALWRPIIGIREADLDQNPDTIADVHWTPMGAQASNPRPGETNFTPNFPTYTSGHATIGAAAFQTLARFYGTDDIAFAFISDEFNGETRGSDGLVRPIVERSYNSFTEAKIENAQSRIYLGIHWAFDATDGIVMGDSVADYVFDNTLKSATIT